MQKFSEVIAGLLCMAVSAAGAAQERGGEVQQGQHELPRQLRAQAGWRPLAPQALADKRAGSDTVSNNMDVAGTVSGNAAINVVTGANAISGASFANAAGLPVAIQNSGANVLIQNATIINVQMR
ncbi:hypothetical protein [Duganella qianjiadongensis]|uniref:hypothetical protein n=1 Tax=Duganella qianjiadongensis TaxID=2692176 RepID=UPI001E2F2966|nr:hypothetical protein [Duganella qianjiadongensis]